MLNRWMGRTLVLAGSLALVQQVPRQLDSVRSLADLSRTAHSVELSDGTVYFVSPPRLDPDSVYSNRSSTAALAPTYYFTLEIPTDAGEPLSQITITQHEGNTARQRVLFRPENSFAFTGTRSDRGDEVPLSSATFDVDSQTLALTFDPPVEPGTTLTVGIRPRNNPLSEGVYLFGITVYPPGEQAHGQFLGYGRLHFYQRDSIFF